MYVVMRELTLCMTIEVCIHDYIHKLHTYNYVIIPSVMYLSTYHLLRSKRLKQKTSGQPKLLPLMKMHWEAVESPLQG